MLIKKTASKAAAYAGLFSCLCLSINASAATVLLMGDTVVYEYDDQQTALALFGTPSIIGDTVRFIPPNFRAESTDGEGTVTTTANFIFDRVYSKSGAELQQITITEFGDYEIDVGDKTEVDLLLTATSNVNALDFTGDFGVACPSCNQSLDFTGDSNGKQTWGLQASINPMLLFSDDANDMAISIQNTLSATTDEFGENAWIQKKLNFTASTVVPLPASAWLFISALGLLRVWRAKR